MQQLRSLLLQNLQTLSLLPRQLLLHNYLRSLLRRKLHRLSREILKQWVSPSSRQRQIILQVPHEHIMIILILLVQPIHILNHYSHISWVLLTGEMMEIVDSEDFGEGALEMKKV